MDQPECLAKTSAGESPLGRTARAATLAVALVLVGSTAACGGTDGDRSGVSDGPASVVPQASGEPPKVRIGIPYPDERQLELAEETLVRECMRAAGYEYTVTPPPERPPPTSWNRGDDIESAATNGYGLVQSLRRNAQKPGPLEVRDDPDTRSLSDAEKEQYSQTLNGTPSAVIEFRVPGTSGVGKIGRDGCRAKAQQRLYGDLQEWAPLMMMVDNFESFIIRRAMLRDPAVQRRTERWASCMQEKGYNVTEPEEAYNEARSHYDGLDGIPEQPVQAEIDIAVADAECNKEVGLAEVKVDVYRKQLQKLLDQYEAELLSYREKQESAMQRAEQILS